MSGQTAWLVLLAPLAPLMVTLLALSRRGRPFLPFFSIAAPLPALGVALTAASDRIVTVPWLLLQTRASVDEVGRAFLVLFSLLWLVAAWHSFHYLRANGRRSEFSVYFLLAMAGNLGTAVMQDAISFYACFALMSFASYGMVAHDRTPEALRAGRIYIVLVVLGEMAVFSGLLLTVLALGGPFGGQGATTSMALLLLGIGFSVKAGLVPLHFWLPLAHPAAPVPASAVLSGAMIKVGLLGGIRFLPAAGSLDAANLLMTLGSITAIYGVVIGTVQSNPKALLAYSSVSQMGLFAIGLGLAYQPGASGLALAAILLLALHHGFAKAALFLGTALSPGSCTGWPRALRLAGLMLPAAALAGAPLTSGAVAKGALKSVAEGPLWLDTFLALSSTGTTILLIQFLRLMWRKRGDEKPGTLWPWLASVALSVSIMWIWPLAGGFLGYSMTGPALIASLWPVLIGTALGIILNRWTHVPVASAIPPGDLIVPLERGLRRLRFIVTEFLPAMPAYPAGLTGRVQAAGKYLGATEAKAHVWRFGSIATAILAGLIILTLML